MILSVLIKQQQQQQQYYSSVTVFELVAIKLANITLVSTFQLQMYFVELLLIFKADFNAHSL
jgi:hypothetical protein